MNSDNRLLSYYMPSNLKLSQNYTLKWLTGIHMGSILLCNSFSKNLFNIFGLHFARKVCKNNLNRTA